MGTEMREKMEADIADKRVQLERMESGVATMADQNQQMKKILANVAGMVAPLAKEAPAHGNLIELNWNLSWQYKRYRSRRQSTICPTAGGGRQRRREQIPQLGCP